MCSKESIRTLFGRYPKNGRKVKNIFRRLVSLVVVPTMLANLFTGFVAASSSVDNTAPGAPTGLLMELREQPFGIEASKPVMSWIVNDADNNEVQTAYQILVATTSDKIAVDEGDVWDSGKIQSAESSNACYGGPALTPNSTYYWKVRTWDKDDAVSPYSEAQRFSTAVDMWEAQAIWVGQSGTIFERKGWKEYDIECDFGITSTALGFSFYTDNTEKNCYMWQIRSDENVLRPHTFTNGSPSTDADVNLSNYNITVGANETHSLKISLRESTITTYIDGVQVDTRSMSKFSYGSIGFRAGNSESGWIDNLKITNKHNTVLYENDFSENASGFNAGAVTDGRLVIGNGVKAYYQVEEESAGNIPVVEPRGNVFFTREDFTVDESKTVDSAVLSITAILSGYKDGGSGENTRQWTYKAYVNGDFAGMGPHMTSNLGKYFYNNFDVTDLIQSGDNTVGAIVYALQDQRFQAQLKITYTDGTYQTVASGEGWKTLDGTGAFGEGEASIGNSAYFTAMAENIDARLYPYGWNQPGYDETAWSTPDIKEQITELAASPMDPMYENEYSIEKVVDKGDGNFFIDLGKEIVGGLSLTLELTGVAGKDLTLLYGEELNGANSVKWQMRTGNNYREYWTLADGQQTFRHFGMKNFRYVEIQGCPDSITKDMLEQNLKAVAIHMKFDDEASYFVSNDEVLNRIYDFCKYSIKVTTQDLYVDSQSRERGPYEGDAYVNQLSHYVFDRNYTPARFTNEFMAYNPEWCTEYEMMNAMSFWLDYMYTGNSDSISKNYDKISTDKVLSSYYDEQYQMIESPDNQDLVDWPESELDGYRVKVSHGNSYSIAINAFNYKAALDVAKMAQLLGKTEDADKFNSLAANLKNGIMQLYDENLGRFYEGRTDGGNILTEVDPAQHASFYPLAMGVVDDEEKKDSISDFLAAEGIQCSVYATQFLFDAMYNAGNDQGALDMLLSKDIRSYYHLIYELGATVSTEAWDPSLKSNMTFSHAWGSAAGNTIVRNLCGVQPLEAGYSKAQIKPALGDLEKISMKTPNIKGYIYVDVDTTNKAYYTDMKVTIPANTTAKVYVPTGASTADTLLVDGETVAAQREGKYLVVDNVGSGTHTFQVCAYLKLSASLEDGKGFAGQSKQINLNVSDYNGNTVSISDATISYASSNEKVASVNTNGLISLLAEGNANIHVAVTFTNVTVNGISISELILTDIVHIEVDDYLNGADVYDFSEISKVPEVKFVASESDETLGTEKGIVKNLGELPEIPDTKSIAVRVHVTTDRLEDILRYGFGKNDTSSVNSGDGYNFEIWNSSGGRRFRILSGKTVLIEKIYYSNSGINAEWDATYEFGLVQGSDDGTTTHTAYIKRDGVVLASVGVDATEHSFGKYVNVYSRKNVDLTIGTALYNPEIIYDFSEISKVSEVTYTEGEVDSSIGISQVKNLGELPEIPDTKNIAVRVHVTTDRLDDWLRYGFGKNSTSSVNSGDGYNFEIWNSSGGRRFRILSGEETLIEKIYYSSSGINAEWDATYEFGLVQGSTDRKTTHTAYIKRDGVLLAYVGVDASQRNFGNYVNVYARRKANVSIGSAVLDSKTIQAVLTDSLSLKYTLGWKADFADAARSAKFVMNGVATDGVVEGTYNSSTTVFSGIRAQNIADIIKATFGAGEERVTYQYSVMDYFKTILDSTDTTIAKLSEMKHLIVDLIQYGAEVQKYRGETDTLSAYVTGEYAEYDGDATTEATFTDLDGVVASAEKLTGTAKDTDPKWKSVALVLKDKINMRCKFNASDVTNLTVKVYVEGISDPIAVLDKSDFVAIDQDGNYYLDFDNIQVNEYNKKFSFKFYKGEDIVGQTLNYSVNTYLSAKQGVQNMSSLLAAINACGKAAQAYVSEQ